MVFFQDVAVAAVAVLTLALGGGCSRSPHDKLQAAVNPLNDKNYPLAIKELSLLAARYPADARIRYYLAFAHMHRDEHERALESLEKTLGLDAAYATAVGDVRMADFLAGNSEDTRDAYFRLALLELQKIIAANPASEISDRVQFHLAHYYLWKANHDGALRAFRKVIDMPPDDTEYDLSARLMIGNIYLNHLDDEELGIKNLQLLAERYPRSEITAEALFVLAEYDRDKMAVYRQRHQSLSEFVRKWSGDAVFGREAETARGQSERDLKMAEEYRARAVAGYRRILSDHGGSGYHSRAKIQLERL